jgi:hypothetical protein
LRAGGARRLGICAGDPDDGDTVGAEREDDVRAAAGTDLELELGVADDPGRARRGVGRPPAFGVLADSEHALRPVPLISRPAREANLARNRHAAADREGRWSAARDALWAVLERHVSPGAAVAVVGAGNAHDLPLTRLLARAATVDLIDLSAGPSRRALRREPAALRGRGRALRCDVTGGVADRIVNAARQGGTPRDVAVPRAPVGTGRYDVVVGDLFYSQLLYPALLDAGLASHRIGAVLDAHGQPLCDAVVARLHASAGLVVHVHDRLGWWKENRPSAPLEAYLAGAASLADAPGPRGCDLPGALERCGRRSVDRALWRWPFGDGVDYLVEALVATSVLHA